MGKTVEPSGEFMELLTDALRAGPGSPEWHQAVLELRKQGGDPTVDEYKLLWTARERLASGKDYRSVRPGPGFTRRVMGEIERLPQGGTKARSVSLATTIAVASLLVLIGVVAIVAYWIYGTRAPSAARNDIGSLVFVQPALDENFRAGNLDNWRAIGSLGLHPGDGLRPAAATTADYVGGGLVSVSSIGATEPFALEVDLRGTTTENMIPQVFVTDTYNFHADRATSPHELVWTLQDGQAQVVLPTGRVEGARQQIAGKTTVRLVITRDTASVETGGRHLWTGRHDLAPDRPRYVGVRFLARAGGTPDIAITAVRVQKTAAAR